MVGLNDIPCVGTALNQISEATVGAAKRECSYLLYYKRNFTTLEDEFKELGIQQEQMIIRILRDRDDAKIIQKHVVIWQNEVDDLNRQIEDFKKRYQDRPYWFKCFRSRSFPNLYSRFQLGREAVKKTVTVTALTKRTKEYLSGEISNHPSFGYSPKSSTDYMDFRSRKNAYSKMLEALKNEDGPTILGIYGMPGVGKTRMMEEASKQSMGEGVFHKVARADVSQVVDVQKLQGQLARDINLHFPPEADEKQRASLLEIRFREGTKFLVIFDDVWGKVPLNEIGIPFGDVSINGCKILLTSRTQDACDNNKCKDVIKIGILEKGEAWELFKKNVDASTLDSLSDKNLVMDVCEQCGGLPLVIVALGNALQNKPEVSWRDALAQLKNSDLENIGGIDPKMCAGLKLSFKHLPKDSKSCLLLSSLFVEDAEIQFEELFKLVKGSGLLKDYDTIEDARIRVGSMVANLKSSSLLLGGQDDTVKLHDIVRDVARSIAATDQEYAFLSKSCGSQWPDADDCSGRKLIDLRFKSSLVDFPEDMVFPDLRILRLECGNPLQHPPDKFFTGFPNLRVLLLYNVSFSPQRSSIPDLANLRMLTISNCELSELSLIVLLKKLEILSLHLYVLPDQPLDLGGLKRLRMLHLKHCIDIAMLPHALSSLSSLEELHIPDGFRIWDEAAREFSPISPELSILTRLTNLAIHLDDAMSCPDENICKNLLRFKISVGQAYRSWEHSSATRSLKFFHGNLEGGVKTLVERAEEVFLLEVTGLQNFFTITDREAFVDLTRLIIKECNDAEHLARIPDKQVHQPLRSFSKLSVLEIKDSGFKYLFCTSFARCLVQLQKLFIYDCEEMEEIVRNESHEDIEENIVFPNLTSMKLYSLPELKSFYRGNGISVQQSLFSEMVAFPALKKLKISGLDKVQHLFNGKVVFPTLEILDIYSLETVTQIWEKQYHIDDSFCELKMLKVKECPKLETVIPPTMVQKLQHLKEPSVLDCKSVISEVEGPSGGA